mmetsp:Transcript_3263/g.13408  ORF Transcript_3263/g.13408 Transcript_3263/m.13408 type:complete len:404 (+) Transcript_3263:2582-3793(+)
MMDPATAAARSAAASASASGRWYPMMRLKGTGCRDAVSSLSSSELRARAGGIISARSTASGVASQRAVLASRHALAMDSDSGSKRTGPPFPARACATASAIPAGPFPAVAMSSRARSAGMPSHHCSSHCFSDSAISRKADWSSTTRGSERDRGFVSPVRALSGSRAASAASASVMGGPVAPSSRPKKRASAAVRVPPARNVSTRARTMSSSDMARSSAPAWPSSVSAADDARRDLETPTPRPATPPAEMADGEAGTAPPASAAAPSAGVPVAPASSARPCPAASAWYTPLARMSSSWEPCSTFRPESRTTIVVARVTVESRCAMRIEVSSEPPGPLRRRSIARDTWRSDSESRAEVASSPMKMEGFRTRARAMATRCFWPPESWPPPSPTSVRYPRGRASTNA